MRCAVRIVKHAVAGGAGWGVLLAAIVVILGSGNPAQAEIWCRRDLGGGHAMCGFASAQQCLASVRVSGGACEREGALRRAEPRRAVHGASYRGARYSHYSSTPLPVNLNPSRFDCSN